MKIVKEVEWDEEKNHRDCTGRVLFAGTPDELLNAPNFLTAKYLHDAIGRS